MGPLVDALKDESSTVRRDALLALAVFADPKTIEPILDSLQDKDIYVVSAARHALNQITGKNFGSHSEKWLQWWEENKEQS